jgi:hypothetical protein
MRTKRLNAAKQVADRLFAAEEAIDLAYTRIAELNAALPTARLDAKLSAVVGQDAITSVAKAMVSAARMRELIVTTHHRLQQTSVGIGLGAVAFGDELKIPSANAMETPAAHLRQVA